MWLKDFPCDRRPALGWLKSCKSHAISCSYSRGQRPLGQSPKSQASHHLQWKMVPEVQVTVPVGQNGLKSLQKSAEILGQLCLYFPSLRHGVRECCFSRVLSRINELTFENCLGDEWEVLSITASCGSLKITSLKRSDK